MFSKDRGIIFYSPVIVLFIFGIGYRLSKKKGVELGLISVPATCLILYSMFSDPYGGWAFGSRYLIAAMPELCILAGIGLQRFTRNIFIKTLYTLIFCYSAAVALLAPLTTNVIPPTIEASPLGLDSSYIINIRMLENSSLDSYVYNHVLHGSITGTTYYFIILTVVLLAGMFFIWYPKKYPQLEEGV